ncbi:hypothetical protein QBC46DRAFT_274376 [Diplogelasinospora grovesii]|uniref:Uncharacterized protein n=1 Tax=Diplogelasinospora grovesii TaxID=303347 RepID=A0AAN6RY41_9PEZI|nr:hypothetical protein QBC46DRAFT_274376 [Diplogelasinospora grovesii]
MTATCPEAVSPAHSPKPAGRTLRERKEPSSYKEPSGGGGSSKPKQHRLMSVKVPKIPPRCCQPSPSMFGPEAAKQLFPFLTRLCHPHLKLYATQTSAIAFAQKATSMESRDSLSATSLDTGARRPIRRRAASLSDLTQHMSKRPWLDVPPPFRCAMRTSIPRNRPIHDRITDDAYRRRVLAELQEKSMQATPRGSHDEGTDQLVRKLLERVEQPNTDSSWGAVEALFCNGDEAARLVEPDSPGDAPIITQDQQQFRWSEDNRTIVQFLRRMGTLDKSVPVQIPSRKSGI